MRPQNCLRLPKAYIQVRVAVQFTPGPRMTIFIYFSLLQKAVWSDRTPDYVAYLF